MTLLFTVGPTCNPSPPAPLRGREWVRACVHASACARVCFAHALECTCVWLRWLMTSGTKTKKTKKKKKGPLCRKKFIPLGAAAAPLISCLDLIGTQWSHECGALAPEIGIATRKLNTSGRNMATERDRACSSATFPAPLQSPPPHLGLTGEFRCVVSGWFNQAMSGQVINTALPPLAQSNECNTIIGSDLSNQAQSCACENDLLPDENNPLFNDGSVCRVVKGSRHSDGKWRNFCELGTDLNWEGDRKLHQIIMLGNQKTGTKGYEMQCDVLELKTAVGRTDVENISPSDWFQSGLILDG